MCIGPDRPAVGDLQRRQDVVVQLEQVRPAVCRLHPAESVRMGPEHRIRAQDHQSRLKITIQALHEIEAR
jgi:hypothetical protein